MDFERKVGAYGAEYLAILNSKLCEWLFNQIGTTTGVGTNRWKKYKLETLFVKYPSVEEESIINLHINQLINKCVNSQQIIDDINKIIYKIYELTSEEASYIDNL